MSSIEEIRSKINEIDAQLVELLGERFDLVEQMHEAKQVAGAKLRDESRWADVQKRAAERAEARGLNPKGVNAIFDQVHEYALKYIYEAE